MRNQAKFRNYVSKFYCFFRHLPPRRISSCTPKCTWGSPSRTSAATAASPSPTAPTSRSTWGSIWASSPTDVKYASASSPSSHISSSTSGLTLATSPTSVGIQVCVCNTKSTSSSIVFMSMFHYRLHQGVLPALKPAVTLPVSPDWQALQV